MKVRAGLPAGVVALLFDEAQRRRALERRFSGALEAAGFSEVLLPILDYADPYATLLDPGQSEQLYRFVDRDGQLLQLRSDFTPMLARLLVPRFAALRPPLRLYYRGDVVRWEENAPGRLRESAQLGVEVIDRAVDRLDTEHTEEVVDRFVELLSDGLMDGAADADAPPPLVVVLGWAGLLEEPLRAAAEGAMGADDAAAAAARAALATRDRARARRLGAAFAEIVETGVPADPASLGPEAAERLERLAALRSRLADRHRERRARFVVDLAEFAGPAGHSGGLAHAYYDGPVFRGFAGVGGRTLGGGGRYDRLFAELGLEVSAAGFSIGLDACLENGDADDDAGEEDGGGSPEVAP